MADLQRTVYPQWSPVDCRPSAGQGQFAGQRPAFCQLCYATNRGVRGVSGVGGKVEEQWRKRFVERKGFIQRLSRHFSSFNRSHFDVLEAHRTCLVAANVIVVCHSSSALVSINQVNLRRAWLVLGWVTMSGFSSRCRTFISLCI